MSISIIIPVFNEEQYIEKLLLFLSLNSIPDQEIIVVDGGSTDRTTEIVEKYPFQLIQCDCPSRASQMNTGARAATSKLLYFVHADVGLVPGFTEEIEHAISKGFTSGCFSCRFVDPSLMLLKVNAFFTRFPFRWCRGGDQTLFITKHEFEDLGGYNEDMVIMEDYELIDKLMDRGSFKVIKRDISISARKYKKNSYFKVQMANLKAMKMYRRGESTHEIKAFYSSALKS